MFSTSVLATLNKEGYRGLTSDNGTTQPVADKWDPWSVAWAWRAGRPTVGARAGIIHLIGRWTGWPILLPPPPASTA